jgi:hypothetical protein
MFRDGALQARTLALLMRFALVALAFHLVAFVRARRHALHGPRVGGSGGLVKTSCGGSRLAHWPAGNQRGRSPLTVDDYHQQANPQ